MRVSTHRARLSNDLRISCGRNAGRSEFYGPLPATDCYLLMEPERVAPASCMRWLDGRPLQVSHLYAMRRASRELSSPDAECTGDDETEARDPERSVPSANDRGPMGQHSRQMKQSDHGKQSSCDNQVGSHRCPPELQPGQRLNRPLTAV